MSQEKVRVGVIGVGQIGKQHLKSYRSVENAEVVAIADINESEANKAAAEFGVANVYADFREMLKRDDLEAVDVCLHNNFHCPMTVAALEAGKNVYCEKPMAGSFRDAQTMFDTARERNLKLHIQLGTLYNGAVKAAKSLIDEGELGSVYHARSTGFRRRGRPFVDGYGTANFVQKRNAGGGALYDMGVYHIAMMLYLLGNPGVARITGKTYQKTAMDEAKRAESNYDVEELGLGFVRLDGDLTLDIIEAWAIHLGGFEGSSLVGTKGGVRINPYGGEPLQWHRDVGGVQTDSTLKVGNTGDTHAASQRHWVEALRGREELLPTAQIALNTMLISEGIYLSEKLNREVSADEVREMSVSTAR